MKLLLPFLRVPAATLTFALLFNPGSALAQSSTITDFVNACPAFPTQFADTLRWEAKQFPGTLFCRALLADGTEAFALTVSAQSPFKPKRGLKAETSTLANGRELVWYRSELVTQSNMQARETLVQIASDRVAHLSLQAADPETLARYESYAAALPFPDYAAD